MKCLYGSIFPIKFGKRQQVDCKKKINKGRNFLQRYIFGQPRFRQNNSDSFCPHSAFLFAHLSVSCVLKPNPLLLTLFQTLGSRDLTAGRSDSCEHMRSSRPTLFTVTISLILSAAIRLICKIPTHLHTPNESNRSVKVSSMGEKMQRCQDRFLFYQ